MADFEFWDKLKYLFSDPNLFFGIIKKEQGIKDSLIMYAIVSLFMTVVSSIFYFGLMSMIAGSLMSGGYFRLSGFFMPAFGVAGFIIGIIMTFLYSALVHVIVIAFKGKAGYSGTYNAYTYSMIPYLILSTVPLVGFLAIIYSFILMIIGVSEVQNISKGKAALACLLPLIVVLGIFLFLIFSFIMRLF
ncbi:YIP1 family protein [Candidatus Woesearchaeota archaeon]|nr:YIP1 family protein [Candidatus Woesearchaeota archaeon]